MIEDYKKLIMDTFHELYPLSSGPHLKEIEIAMVRAIEYAGKPIKQRFRISQKITFYGLVTEYEALNQEAKYELWRYFPELKKRSIFPDGNTSLDSIIHVTEGSRRMCLPSLMRL